LSFLAMAALLRLIYVDATLHIFDEEI